MTDLSEAEARYLRAALDAGTVARRFLGWMEQVFEQLAPERSAGLAAQTERDYGAALRAAVAALDEHPSPADLAGFAPHLREALAHVEETYEQFTSFPSAPPHERIPRILGAMHTNARAQEAFYLLRQAIPAFEGYWIMPRTPAIEAASRRDADGRPRSGVVHVSAGGHHGGFSLYVPEHLPDDHRWPVIVALHGGSGNGRDFLWTWVREAKSCGYLLVAPSSVGDTWDSVDDRGVFEILGWLDQRYRLDKDRILLTGLSDGATFALLFGLAHPEVYRALAPLCGVLHPANAALGNLDRARGVPIYLVHGALDFLFPVQLARMARDTLTAAGSALEYRELPELSHTYPRSENARIIEWFERLPPR